MFRLPRGDRRSSVLNKPRRYRPHARLGAVVFDYALDRSDHRALIGPLRRDEIHKLKNLYLIAVALQRGLVEVRTEVLVTADEQPFSLRGAGNKASYQKQGGGATGR